MTIDHLNFIFWKFSGWQLEFQKFRILEILNFHPWASLAPSLLTGVSMHVLLIVILMHLQMQRDVWLDNIINLRQYILRYTVGNSTSLHNVAFHWLTSEHMQLTSRFMQLAAAVRIGTTKYFFTVFLKGKC